MGHFAHYIGVDYSGAETPTASLKGLRVYMANRDGHPTEVLPPPSPRKYWTRRGLAHWLVETLSQSTPTLVGINHGFSFPMSYFEKHGLLLDWPFFLDDFQQHWPTDNQFPSPEDSRRGHRRAPFCVMIQVLKSNLTQEYGGDEWYL